MRFVTIASALARLAAPGGPARAQEVPAPLPVGLAGVTSGTLEGPSDTDLYGLRLAAGEVVAIGGLSDGGVDRMELLAPGGAVVASKDISGDRQLAIEYRAPGPGPAAYLLRLSAGEGHQAGEALGYSVWARPDCLGGAGTGCEFGTPSWAAWSFAGADDADWLYADLTAGRTYTFAAESACSPPEMRLYDGSGAVVGRGVPGLGTSPDFGSGARLVHRPARSGRYHVVLSPGGDDWGCDYRTRLTAR